MQLWDSDGLLQRVKRTVSVISVEFFGNSKQLQQHDRVYLSSAYTDDSFSSFV